MLPVKLQVFCFCRPCKAREHVKMYTFGLLVLTNSWLVHYAERSFRESCASRTMLLPATIVFFKGDVHRSLTFEDLLICSISVIAPIISQVLQFAFGLVLGCVVVLIRSSWFLGTEMGRRSKDLPPKLFTRPVALADGVDPVLAEMDLVWNDVGG